MVKKAVLLIGFGGPTALAEVRPFLASIVGEARVPTQRVEEVYRHYEMIGGVSPFNAITECQRAALEKNLANKGFKYPIGVAYRHSSPGFKDAFESFKKYGVESVTGFVLASFRSFVSREWYHDKAAEGRKLAGAENIRVEYTAPFEMDPLYLAAQRERAEEIWSKWSDKEKDETCVIFTAHSIPSSMCEQSCQENERRCYGYQFRQAAEAIAEGLGAKNWKTSYQSQAGGPRQMWLDPDIKDVIKGLDPKKFKRVLLVPVGFLCDNVEVIYDLDHEAKDAAEAHGLRYFRAGTVGDHPLFIEMMAERILEKETSKC
jgi:protoporphyrin/coproporphyrin ferrochelatase